MKSGKKMTLPIPLPIYKTLDIGFITGRDGTEFTLCAGLSSKHVLQLKDYSLDKTDEAIQNNTSDRDRFGTGSYEDWYAKNRVPFSVVDTTTGILAALIWFGPKPLGEKSMSHIKKNERPNTINTIDSNWHTIAYRSYKPYRGVGIMKKAVHMSTGAYLSAFPSATLWAIVDENNPASVGLSEALGYEVASKEDGFVVMVRG